MYNLEDKLLAFSLVALCVFWPWWAALILFIGWFLASNLLKFFSLTLEVVKYSRRAKSKALTLSKES
jgi:hypothetical protein